MKCIFVAEDKSNIQIALYMELCGNGNTVMYSYLTTKTNLRSQEAEMVFLSILS